jgi:hypothetical protein
MVAWPGAEPIPGVHRGAEVEVHNAFLDPHGGGNLFNNLVHRPVRGAPFRCPFPARKRRLRARNRSRRTRRATASRQGYLDNFDLGCCLRRARRLRRIHPLTHSLLTLRNDEATPTSSLAWSLAWPYGSA